MVAAGVLLAGCVSMPTDGPVVQPPVPDESDEAPGVSFDPPPPRAGDSAAEIVDGFFEAMTATPVTTKVARQFLSSEAADTWAPDEQIITYAEPVTASGESFVRVPLTGIEVYDERGAWQRTQDDRDLEISLVQEDGEWRIDSVPNALIVPDSWFDDQYQRSSLFFFNPTAEVLVAEPVFVPRGDQSASSLVRGLVTRPPTELQDVVRTYFPAGTRDGLSVPIVSGIATVALSGDPAAVSEETGARMLAQLAWTLRQEQRVRAIQLSVGDRAIIPPEGSSLGNLDAGDAFDPDGLRPVRQLYALDGGKVVSGTFGAFEETLGPLGQGAVPLRTIGVSLSGLDVAGVSADGTELSIAPTEAPEGEVTTAVTDAVDLAAPSWDYRDRVWVLDRGRGRAQVVVVTEGEADVVDVPGLTDRNVTKLLVSRDGTRLVAVVRGRTADRVVSARIRHDEAGAILGFTPLTVLPLPEDLGPRIRDIGWRSPTSISVLSDVADDNNPPAPTTATANSQVRTISVDGSPGEITTGGISRLRGRIRSLVSAPIEGSEVFGLGRGVAVSLALPERTVPTLPEGLTALTYVG